MSIYCLGDVHGGFRSLKQCLELCKFNYENDTLICLGDVVDGWPETPFVIEELLKMKHLILIQGNHDNWCYNFFKYGSRPTIWTMQGGQATIDAYIKEPALMIKHSNFFDRALKYYVDDKNRIFVHGGFNPAMPIDEQHADFITWDRGLYDNRNNSFSIEPYTEAFIGHTSTWNISHYPFCRNGVWFLDQGGGFEGVLTIMDVDTHKFWQSDRVELLYPGFHGR